MTETWYKIRLRPFTFEKVTVTRSTPTLVYVDIDGSGIGRRFTKNDYGTKFLPTAAEAFDTLQKMADENFIRRQKQLEDAKANVEKSKLAWNNVAELRKLLKDKGIL